MSVSQKQLTETWSFNCDLQIVVTVAVFFGVMLIYLLRMWRVYKVFTLYDEYLAKQLSDISSDTPLQRSTETKRTSFMEKSFDRVREMWSQDTDQPLVDEIYLVEMENL